MYSSWLVLLLVVVVGICYVHLCHSSRSTCNYMIFLMYCGWRVVLKYGHLGSFCLLCQETYAPHWFSPGLLNYYSVTITITITITQKIKTAYHYYYYYYFSNYYNYFPDYYHHFPILLLPDSITLLLHQTNITQTDYKDLYYFFVSPTTTDIIAENIRYVHIVPTLGFTI